MTSLIVHISIAFIVSVILVTQTQQFKDLVGAEVLAAKDPPKPKVRRLIIKPVQKPKVLVTNPVVVEQVQVQPRATSAAAVRTASLQPQTVSEFSNQVVRLDAPINPNVPKVINPRAKVPSVMTHVELPVSDAPDALAASSPVAASTGGTGKGIGRGVGRGSGGIVQVKAAFHRPPGLSMVDQVGAARDALEEVVKNVRLGNVDVPSLPRGEPGGRVIGKGRDIRGVFRFTRLRHSLSDWWADASALSTLTKWLNEKTKIKTDMNVEGGSVKLTDANLMKSPLLIMTGHDPTLVRGRSLLGQYGGGKLDDQLSQSEAAALRRYLVEKGGFLIFDDCGINDPDRGMTRLFLAQMRYVLPEYQVGRIPNDHEVYNNFYAMGGPPIGFDIYQVRVASAYGYSRDTGKQNFLKGITIDGKLSILVVRRDYMCAMEAIDLPSRAVHYSPGVYRFMTNVVVYALTHGGISDYSRYVPENSLEQQPVPTRAPEASKIGAVE